MGVAVFVITADQVASRSSPDLMAETISRLESLPGFEPVLPAVRTVGDEFQLVLSRGSDVLAVVLSLTRDGLWSVGCGVGDVVEPLGATARESRGAAFIAAREAVDKAKGRPYRFALLGQDNRVDATDCGAMIDLVLALRARRSAEGWELYDLLAEGSSQAEVAARLGITPQAVSNRARNADLRVETAAILPLERMLDVVGSRQDRRGTDHDRQGQDTRERSVG